VKVLDQYLKVKRSRISGAGRGLFTTVPISKGSAITEYKGKISSWNDADHDEGLNAYIFYVNRNHVIDAKGSKALAHFANDASGITKMDGMKNNSQYTTRGKRVFIEAKRDIKAGEEILVAYGKEYWTTIVKNYKDKAR